MTADTITWDSIRDNILSDPEVKTEYDALNYEFELIKTVITLREKIGLSQRQFAAKVGMKQSQLARIESGRQMPKLKTLAKLAAAAGYNMEINFIPTKIENKDDTKSLLIKK